VLVTLSYSVIVGIGPWWSVLILSILGSVASQIGDLSASKIKRYVGIKDFGKIMPGHGGMLDRFDSIIFASPVVYYYVIYFLK
jgi:phosphatidate cytidylyltransferase